MPRSTGSTRPGKRQDATSSPCPTHRVLRSGWPPERVTLMMTGPSGSFGIRPLGVPDPMCHADEPQPLP